MKKSVQIAKFTFQDALRNHANYGVFAFLIFILATATLLATVTMGNTALMISDIGLGSISIIANLIAIIITIQSLQDEKNNRTLYILLTRLDHRWQYLTGKFLGLSAMLAIQVIVMFTILAAAILPFEQIQWLSYWQACLTTILEIAMLIALAMLLSQSSSLFLAILFTFCIDVAGRFTFSIQQFGEQSGIASLKFITTMIYYILPNFEALNFRNDAAYIEQFPWSQLFQCTVYAVGESAFLLLFCIFIFSRRNLS